MPQKQIELTEKFIKDLNRLDRNIQKRVISILYKLRDGVSVDLRKLRGTDDEWRIRVGVYRIRFQITEKGIKIYALRVMHRRDAYWDL